MSVFEIGMLLCFGFAWPISIVKSVRTKSIEGKSLLFMYIILMGYVFGMAHKIFYNFDFVLILYALNFVMVFADLMLYYRNKKRIDIYS